MSFNACSSVLFWYCPVFSLQIDPLILIQRVVHDLRTVTEKGLGRVWFMWTLLDDSFAAGAFTGDDPELYRNEKWQDVYNKQSTNLPENPDPYDPDAASENIFTRLINAIRNLFAKIKEFFNGFFKG